MSATIVDLIADLRTALAGVAPVAFARKAEGLNVAPPYYFVYLTDERYGQPQGPGFSSSPRVLHTREVDLQVESWGAGATAETSIAATDALNAAFITALRQVVSGANYRLIGGSWSDGASSGLGSVFILRVSVILRLNEQDLTNPPVGADVTTVVPEEVDNDTDDAVFGDPVLQAGADT